MNIALLGFDVEGRASYDYFSAQGHTITICDQDPNKEVPEGAATQLGAGYLDNLERFDLLVRTPGLPPAKILEKNPGVASKITSATNEFLAHCPTKNVIGITGTKGKGTTSTLIAKILEAAGKKVFLGGNIGVPALSFMSEVTTDDWVVLELSSFQLIDVRHSPYVGVCLMVMPEHLNWHTSLQEYIDAKRRLFQQQTPDDLMVYNADNDISRDIAGSSPARKLWYSTRVDALDRSIENPMHRGAFVQDGHIYMDETEVCAVEEVGLLGAHNWQNICAAIAATWDVTGRNREVVRSVVTTFRGLEHRLELVRSLDGVAYYDDSFGTTPETAIVAIQAFQEPKVLILGGATKGADFNELARTIKMSNVRHVVIMGNTTNPAHPSDSPKIEAALRGHGYDAVTSLICSGGPNITEVVEAARAAAKPGDVVLLSTACTSFDMFHNYKDRATQFQQAVNSLTSRNSAAEPENAPSEA